MAQVPRWKRLAPIGEMPLSRRRRLKASGERITRGMLKLGLGVPLVAAERFLGKMFHTRKRFIHSIVLQDHMAHAKSLGLPFELRDYEIELDAFARHDLESHGTKIKIGARPVPEFIEALTRNLRNQCLYFERILKREGDVFMLMELPGGGKSLRPPTRVFLRKRNGHVERVVEETADEPSTPKPEFRYKIRYETITWFDKKGRLQLDETSEDLKPRAGTKGNTGSLSLGTR